MASLSKDQKTGTYRVLFVAQDGIRKAVRFGKLKAKQADSVLLYMEDLIYAQVSGRSPNSATAEWIAGLPGVIRKRIERVGLIEPAERKECPTLAEWVDQYIRIRSDVKPNTVIKFKRTQKKLISFFGKSKRLDEITVGDAEAFRIYLKESQAEATTRRLCAVAKQFFHAAIRREMIVRNPFDGVVCSNIANSSRLYFVTREQAQAVLEACPDREWKLIFALCRFGGLRCPTELLSLTWNDVDWGKMRFTVHASKTEHHANGGVRVVPIFPELYPYLLDCYEHAEAGTQYVINRYRETNVNLRTQLNRIIARAGLTPWPKLFQNLRSTRETELAEQYPLQVACAWIGNSKLVAAQHYLQVTENHFQKAAQNPAQYTSESDCIGLDEEVKNLISDSVQAFSNSCNDQELGGMGDTGLEPVTLRV